MSLGTILLIILILLLVGALPTWPYSGAWGYYPSGGLGIVGERGVAVLDLVQVDPRARYLVFFSFDNFWESIDMIDALHPQTFLAYGLNGRDLYGAVRPRLERAFTNLQYAGQIRSEFLAGKSALLHDGIVA